MKIVAGENYSPEQTHYRTPTALSNHNGTYLKLHDTTESIFSIIYGRAIKRLPAPCNGACRSAYSRFQYEKWSAPVRRTQACLRKAGAGRHIRIFSYARAFRSGGSFLCACPAKRVCQVELVTKGSPWDLPRSFCEVQPSKRSRTPSVLAALSLDEIFLKIRSSGGFPLGTWPVEIMALCGWRIRVRSNSRTN